ncbi:MAG: hypothetical protein HY736_00530 [Verrucomicrobia bacterium]|nr:hypothetical protein [Verrucomicrobiota bacterium]
MVVFNLVLPAASFGAPANRAPTISWSIAPGSSADGQTYRISAHGHDDDGNLARVNVWRNGQPHAFAGGGTGHDGDSGNPSTDSGPQTITYTAQAFDSMGASSARISHTISISAPPPVTQGPKNSRNITPGSVPMINPVFFQFISVLGLLPLAAVLLGALWIHGRLGIVTATPPSRRNSLLIAGAAGGAWVVLGTELLNIGHALRFWPVLAWWVVPVLLLTGLLWRDRSRLRAWLTPVGPLGAGAWLLIIPIALLLLASGLTGLLAPTNTGDCLTYHLPRQIYWVQQQGVDFFPTNNVRQNMMPPFAEFVGAQVIILAHGDLWANGVQWFALVMTLAAVSLIARSCGAGIRGQLLAALAVVTIPGSFTMASSAKNDLVLAMWTCAACWWCVEIHTTRRCTPIQACLLATAIGAMLLTKGTGAIFALPLAVWTTAVRWRQCGVSCWRPLAFLIIVPLAMNAPHWARNQQQFGHFAGPVESKLSGTQLYVNDSFRPQLIASNVVRNLAVQLATPSAEVNQFLFEKIKQLHRRWLKLDVDDSRNTFLNLRFEVAWHPYEEDLVAAPVHVALLLLMPLFLLMVRHRVNLGTCLALLAVVAADFLLFSAYLKWQHWHVRLEVPILCLGAALLGAVWTAGPLRPLAPVVANNWLLMLLPTVIWNARPLLTSQSLLLRSDRLEVQCHYYPSLAPLIRQVAQRVASLQPHRIGIRTGSNSPDYILMNQLQRQLRDPVFSVFNPDLPIAGWTEAPPDAVIDSRNSESQLRHRASGTIYQRIELISPFGVYVPAAPTAP